LSAETDPAIVAALRRAGCVFAEEEAALLLAEASDDEALEVMLARRVAGEPLEQVVGWAEFCGRRVRVVPGVFVPRRRTQLLVERAVAVAAPGALVVDLCCGTGAIGLAVADRVPGVELHLADLDPDAVRAARLNAAGAEVHEGDLYDALPGRLRGRVDLVVCNAPYVPTAEIRLMPPEARLHEHHVALDGGVDGVQVHRLVAAAAPEWLAPDGCLLLESSKRQAPETARWCREAGLEVTTWPAPDEDDATVVVRAISARFRGARSRLAQ
jgi:release factor glutamine methyltransferase